MTVEQEIAEIIEGQYKGFRGLQMIELGELHDRMRLKLGDEKYLEFLKKQVKENPRPIYKPIT